VQINDIRLDISYADGVTKTWRSAYDDKAQLDTREFPGGHFLSDYINNVNEYDPGDGQDFTLNADAQDLGGGVYKLVGIIDFRAPVEPGTQMTLQLGDLHFIHWEYSNDDSMPTIDEVLQGEWDFTVDVDGSFAAAGSLTYEVTDASAAAQKGIVIESISVSPSGCRIELSIDYAKNDIADPENAAKASEPQYIPKLNVMNTTLTAVGADGKQYTFKESDYYPDSAGEATECYFVLYSMYFDAPAGFTLRFAERGETYIDVPVVIVP
jgi:hypothetical protein